MNSLLQVKTHVYAVLMADAGLQNLMNGVKFFNNVQEDAVMPYISYEYIMCRKIHELDTPTIEHNLNFVIVAKADSSLTTHNIMARMEEIFANLQENEDLGEGVRLMHSEYVSSNIKQVNFDAVKGEMEVKLLVETGVGL